MPGAASTPEATSTAYGSTAAMPAATFSAVSPPERISGNLAAAARGERPVPGLPRPAALAAGGGVEQVEVGVEALEVLEVRRARDPDRLDHLGAGAARDLGAERRALVAVELDVGEVQRLRGLGDLVEARVDEHADELGAAPQRLRDAGGVRRIRGARRGRPEDEAERPRAELDGELGVLGTGDAADLDARHACRAVDGHGARRLARATARDAPRRSSGGRRASPSCPGSGRPRGPRGRPRRRARARRGSATRRPSCAPAARRAARACRPGGRRRPRRASRPARASTSTPSGTLAPSIPRYARSTRPARSSCGITDLAVLTGTAKPIPTLPPDRAAAGRDLGVDADHAPARVEQRSAGVAGVERRVGLDHVVDREAARRGQAPLQRRHDAGGQRALQAERVADRDRRIADLDRRGVAELERLEIARRRRRRGAARGRCQRPCRPASR